LSPTVLDARSLISSPPRRGLADHSTGSPADFGKLIADKREVRKVIRAANIKPE
jgi:hypothetical protein